MPDPVLVVGPPLGPLGRQLVVHVERPVPPPVRPALELVEGPRARHANVHGYVDGAALVRRVPEGGHQGPYHAVVDADGLRVDDDADGRRLGRVSGADVLGPERREVRREVFGDFPRRVDGVLLPEGLSRACVSQSVSSRRVCWFGIFASRTGKGGLRTPNPVTSTVSSFWSLLCEPIVAGLGQAVL